MYDSFVYQKLSTLATYILELKCNTGGVFETVCNTCLEEFSFEFFSSRLVQFFSFDEALGHSLEVLLRDRPVLVEVDTLEVRLHLANPKLGHDC